MKTLRFPVLLILVACACTYTLEEVDYMVDVKPAVPKGTISLEEFSDQDTIFLSRATEFQYKVDGVGLTNSTAIVILFDGQEIQSSSNPWGTFFLGEPRLKTGTHKLKISFKAPSGSGSLSDRVGTEFLEVWREWTLVSDIDPPPVPEITKSVENGFLKLSWPKYARRNFVKYQVSFEYHPYFQNKVIDITDRNKNFFVDTTYSAGYEILIKVALQNEVATSNSGIVVSENQSFSFVYNSDSTVDMKWRKVKYTGTFKSFVVSLDKPGISDPKTTTITNALDTTLHLKADVVFPHTLQLSFRMLDKFGVERYTKSEYINNPSNAPQTLNADAWYYNPTLGKVMAYDFGQLMLLNTALEVEKTLRNGDFSMPWPGRFIYYPTTGAIAQRNLITDEIKLISIPGVYAPTVSPTAVSGADNNLVNYYAYDLTHAFDRRLIRGTADMSTNTLLNETDVEYDPKTTIPPVVDQLSDDGRYFYTRNQGSLYSVSGATQTYIGHFQNVGGFYGFRPDNNDEIITRFTPTNIVKSSDLTILRTLNLPETGFILRSYDPATKHLLYYKTGADRCYLVNIDTGVAKLIHADGEGCYLINGFLISQGSYYIKVL
jgi:hypothetical protein